MSYKLVKRINRKGWPTKSLKYKKAHLAANKAEKNKYGKRAFNAVQKIVNRMPFSELLGTHTKRGKVHISSRVPKTYRQQIAYHERIEHTLMTRKKR